MIHAKHASEGSVDTTKVDNDSKPDPADPTKTAKEQDEEVRAVGLSPHDDEDITENKIRSEWDPPQTKREWYDSAAATCSARSAEFCCPRPVRRQEVIECPVKRAATST